MSELGETERQLSRMSDEGKFERLATAVLREAEPMYAGLSHPGVNAEGKTVRSPVDGVRYVPGAEPPLLITVHHTTCAPRELRGKWLGGAAPARRRCGTASASNPGDLAKVVDVVRRERERTPSLRARLALTTNQEPTEDLVRDTRALAREAGIEIDTWSRSRIAHFLDQDPEGQWLRRTHLGIAQERLSRALLHELSAASFAAVPIFEPPEAWVERALDTEVANAARDAAVTFVVAASGMGKTTACRKLLARHVEGGGCGLILPDEMVAANTSLDLAVEATLRGLCSTLAEGCGAVARSLCSVEQPLLLIVEDVNRSGARELLLERIAGWFAEHASKAGRNDGNQRAIWRLLCPIWPESVALLRDASRKAVEALSIAGGAFSPTEASSAAQRRAELAGQPLGPLQADALAEALGNDPLLIALYEGGAGSDAQAVIGGFVAGSTRRLAARDGRATASEIRSAFRGLMGVMLDRRRMDPTWREISGWFANRPDVLDVLRSAARQAEVLRLADDGRDERLAFRHDRVREHLLVDAVAELMRAEALPDHVLADPFYAEVLGYALAEPDTLPRWADKIASANPLTLFFALQRFREPSADVHHASVAAIEAWLADPATLASHNHSLRRAVLAALARTTSSLAIGIVERLKAPASWAALEARLRNGDMVAALDVCLQNEPGIHFPWRDRMVAHAQAIFGNRLSSYVDQLLRRSDLRDGARVATLRLAGHIGTSALADAVAVSWLVDNGRANKLKDYLWAGARCCGDFPERLLEPVCEAWAALPATSDGSAPSPRDDLAAHEVSWALRDALPVPALRYFIRRAASDDLRWPITYMLRDVDQPDAVEFIAREMSETDRRLTEAGSWFFASKFTDGWSREQAGQRRTMSVASRSRLRALWRDEGVDANLRKRAFDLWAATEDRTDPDALRSLLHDGLLGDRALVAMLKRGERDVVPLLIQRIESADRRDYWLQFARNVFGTEFVPALDRELARRRAEVEPGWYKCYQTDWIVGELLTRLPPSRAEELLVMHWDHLHFSKTFVLAALYAATPLLTGLVRQTVADCPDPPRLLEHVVSHFGIGLSGRPGVTDIRQVTGLLPYLHLLEPSAVFCFWDLCNERGWYALRRDHLDPALTSEWRDRALLGEAKILADLDRMAARAVPLWIDHWIERFLKTGETKQSLMELVGTWLAARKNLEALRVAVALIAEVGIRSDLPVLTGITAIEPAKVATAVIEDAAYWIRRRTLV